MIHCLHKTTRALFLSLAMLFSLPMLAVEVEIDGINYELNPETKEASVVKKNSDKYSGKIIIPESVEFKSVIHSVTSIEEEAFSDCCYLTSVTIGNAVTSIRDYAFYGCTALTSVTVGNKVTGIGRNAFSGCSSLAMVTMGHLHNRV